MTQAAVQRGGLGVKRLGRVAGSNAGVAAVDCVLVLVPEGDPLHASLALAPGACFWPRTAT